MPGDPAPTGTVDGAPITAGHLRALLGELHALGVRAPVGGELNVALLDENGRLRATLSPGELARLARKGCPEHPDADADADADAEADAVGGCGCAVLDRPPTVGRYAPTPAQRRFVTTRDRGCRFPNCGQRAGLADHDHVVPHGCDGETTCTNLTLLCLVKRRPARVGRSARSGLRARAGRPGRRQRSRGRRSV